MAIRQDILDLILKEETKTQKEIKSENGNELKFANFNDKEDIIKRILEDILKKRTVINYRGEDIKVFYGDDKDKLTGYLSDIYGCTAVLSLVDGDKVTLNEEEKDNLVKNIAYIVREIKTKDFTMFPYISEEDNKCIINGREEQLFGTRYPYIGALTWAISFLSSVRKARIHEVTDQETGEKKTIGYLNIDQELLDEINSLIVLIVRRFNEAVIFENDPNSPNGIKYTGWSYTTNCTEPSLFFTYSVLEAYSDFEDNIFDIGTNPDGSYIVENGTLWREFKEDAQDLRQAFKEDAGNQDTEVYKWTIYCESVARNVWRVYKNVLGREFVSDQFLKGFNIIKTDDMVKMDHTNALFNNVYLVCILLFGWANVLIKDEAEEIVATMESALQNVQRVNDNFMRRGLDYLISTYTVPFINNHKDRDNVYVKRLNYRRISDTTLLPILMKANNLIAFYITKYPVKKMDALFKDIFDDDNICDDALLWDDKGYDVKITERYIEAINQFYDYYIAYEQDYNNNFKLQRSLAFGQGKAAGVKQQKEANKDALKAEQEKADKRVEEAKASFVIENAINERIESKVNEIVFNYLNNIAKKLNGENVVLNDNELKLLDSLNALVKGYLFDFIKNTLPDNKGLEDMIANMDSDFKGAFIKWSEELAEDKTPLTDLLKNKKEN